MDTTSLSLLNRVRDNPREEDWSRLVAIYETFIRKWLALAQIPPDAIDDRSQDVLSTLCRELPNFDHNQQKGAFRRWLRTVVFHRTLMHWRTGHNQRVSAITPEHLDQLSDPHSPLSEQWDREHNSHVLERLLTLVEPEFTPSTWRAFTRQSIDQLPAQEVAAELGLTVNAVVIAKSRVLQRLRHEAAGLIE